MSELTTATERRRKRILVVDDDRAVREMLVRVLAEEGYSADATLDGDNALEIAAAARLDLVLLDLGMPGMDGWKTFEHLTQQHPGLPVIIITAKPGQSATADAVGAGAFFEKPLSFPELLEAIEQLLVASPKPQK